ncbi:DEAD/DEAH box helicase [Tersicoccus solisilvae]|uniref:DEAD/DEAH box helicase n=1 Tax=Tersicoccus solisilvae TaxID=1882339 RepID=A0ABQ1P3C0_9MICC|nr:DEAD/DEAH box helicase [Tersicoccus solisilvae]GGC90221.1 DEAD/DEAH box helicase [Tersicoccus solisilvae]
MDVLDRFSPATSTWFRGAFTAPTAAQCGAWEAISGGQHALVVAPTGSGKTLAAFLWALDSFLGGRDGGLGPRGAAPADADDGRRGTRVLYISPLKALGVDVERNLRAPLIGITQTARGRGETPPDITVGVRSGDTTPADRRQLLSHPPDILITTPESLYLMLTSRARDTLTDVHTIIVDEVHAVAGTKRGAHLALTLERLDALLDRPAQRIGLSATVQPRETVARFLGGNAPVTIVAPPSGKSWDLTVTVPVEDMTELGPAPVLEGSAAGTTPQASIWPHVEEKVVDLIEANRSTIVFANSRRLAERLTARLNEIHADRQLLEQEGDVWATGTDGGAAPTVPGGTAGTRTATKPPAQLMAQAGSTSGAPPVLARAHHGSVSKDQRAEIEDDLKSGRLRCVVATSSLELGIDMGAVDLVIQVESPPSVASGLQRVGRAGHQVGEISRGVLFPKHRGDLVNSAVTVERMVAGAIESLSIPANPLDILAQQTVAATALGTIDVEEWFDTVRRSAPFATLPRSAFDATLDLLAGRYPSDEFAELRPRIVWDRTEGTITGRPGAQRLAVTSGGTIPDRGLFGVFIVGEETGKNPRRVGELDEEMVYESRVGDVFALGATSWRIEDITYDRVLVSPAWGQPGKVPFWKGDSLGRPVELGRALGGFVRELSAADDAVARERLAASGLDDWACDNLLAYLGEQKEATGQVPDDRTLVVERFHDELGDWRIVLHSPFGMPVHAPWALAVGARLQERYGLDGAAMASDDGIVLRVPMMEDDPPGAELFLFEEDELDGLITAEVGGSALFASRFRECAARALLLPRRNPGKRSPLWQQRQRSAQLLDVARKYPTFPIILETVREVLQDVYDVPALKDISAQVARRELRLVEVSSTQPSPFARSLLFGYIAGFLYEGDSPLAERRAAALSLDPTLLNELLGRAELRELLDPGVIEQTEAQLQHVAPGWRVRGAEGVADLLRLLGPLTAEEIAARTEDPDAGPAGPPGGATSDVAALASTVPGGTAPEQPTPENSTSDPADTAGAEPAGAPTASVATVAAWADELVRANRALAVSIAGVARYAAVEDAARLRDAAGVPLPMGVPTAFIEPVPDPLGDLVGRYARTHGPFLVAEAAHRLGLGVAVVATALQRLATEGRVAEGEFRPASLQPAGSAGVTEWCDVEVLRRIRRRSLAALRHDIEPVTPEVYARFLPAWQHIGPERGSLRGLDGVLTVVDQLAGVPVPASAWEPLVLASRVADYAPAMLDELMATGDVLVSGAGELAGNDGWLSLHLAESADLTLTRQPLFVPSGLQQAIIDFLSRGGAWFFRQLADAVRGAAGAVIPATAPDDGSLPASPARPATDDEVAAALWALVWAGVVGNDTYAPVRSLLAGGHTAHTAKRAPARARTGGGRFGRSRLPGHRPGRDGLAAVGRESTLGRGPDLRSSAVRNQTSRPSALPTTAGRWSLLPESSLDPTVQAHAMAELLMDRYGVLTRGSVAVEGTPGGFGTVYKVLSRLEEMGQARRGYFIDGLGAAQFSVPATVDRLRSFSEETEVSRRDPAALCLAATDPANPYGSALAWPALEDTGHRPGRKAGALVALVDGALVLYVERGGRTLLVFDEDPDTLALAARALVAVVRRGAVDKLAVEKVNGRSVLDTPTGSALADAGFYSTPRGLRIRA